MVPLDPFFLVNFFFIRSKLNTYILLGIGFLCKFLFIIVIFLDYGAMKKMVKRMGGTDQSLASALGPRLVLAKGQQVVSTWDPIVIFTTMAFGNLSLECRLALSEVAMAPRGSAAGWVLCRNAASPNWAWAHLWARFSTARQRTQLGLVPLAAHELEWGGSSSSTKVEHSPLRLSSNMGPNRPKSMGLLILKFLVFFAIFLKLSFLKNFKNWYFWKIDFEKLVFLKITIQKW